MVKMCGREITLTDIERACGVTPEQVRDTWDQVHQTPNARVTFPRDTSPALCSAVMRNAYPDALSPRFVGFNSLGMPTYRMNW